MSTVLGPTRPAGDDGSPSDLASVDDGRRPPRLRGDLVAVALACALVAWAAVYGQDAIDRGVDILVGWPPLLAEWLPHTGPGTVPAVVVALLVALGGPTVAARLAWLPLLALTYVASLAWTFSLAMIDGYERGIAERLATPTEYLVEVNRFPGLGPFLETFAGRIVGMTPDTLVTHSSGHPPLATIFYVAVYRWIGDTPGTAGVVTILVGASAAVAVALAVASVGGLRFARQGAAALPRSPEVVTAGRDLARRYIPFGVLFPGAVWVGVSADGVFAAVFAWAVAFFAMGAVRRGVLGHALSFVGGLGFAGALFMSYGLAAFGLAPIAIALLVWRWTPLLSATLGLVVVVSLFHLGGFWWYEGYEQVQLRYYQPGEYGLLRPYSYWVWANLAAFALAIGPAVVAGMRRFLWWPRRVAPGLLALVVPALVAVIVADLSGLSKSEVERIWLPFGTFLVLACTLLPRPSAKWWLLAQAALALTVNHLLLTTW